MIRTVLIGLAILMVLAMLVFFAASFSTGSYSGGSESSVVQAVLL